MLQAFVRLLAVAGFASSASWCLSLLPVISHWEYEVLIGLTCAYYTYWRVDWRIWGLIGIIYAWAIWKRAERHAYAPETLKRNEQEVKQLLHASHHQAINQHRDHPRLSEDVVECMWILWSALCKNDSKLVQALLRLHPGLWIAVMILIVVLQLDVTVVAIKDGYYLSALWVAGVTGLVLCCFSLLLAVALDMLSEGFAHAHRTVVWGASVAMEAGGRDRRIIWGCASAISVAAVVGWVWRRAHLRQAHKRHEQEQEVSQLLHASPHQAINQHRDHPRLSDGAGVVECMSILWSAVCTGDSGDMKRAQELLRSHPGLWVVLVIIYVVLLSGITVVAVKKGYYLSVLGVTRVTSLILWCFSLLWAIAVDMLSEGFAYAHRTVGWGASVALQAGGRDRRIIWGCASAISVAVVVGWVWRRAHLRQAHKRREQEVSQLLHASPHQATNRHRDHSRLRADALEWMLILFFAVCIGGLRLVQALLRLHPGLWMVIVLLIVMLLSGTTVAAIKEGYYLSVLGVTSVTSLILWCFSLLWAVALNMLSKEVAHGRRTVGWGASVAIEARGRDRRIWGCASAISVAAVVGWVCRRAYLRQAHKRYEQEVYELLRASPHQAVNRYRDDHQTIRDPTRCAEILLQAILYKDLDLVQALLRLHPRVGLGATFDPNFDEALDVTFKANWGGCVSLIHVACVMSLPIVKLLVRHDKSWRDMKREHSWRPLHEATARGDHELLAYLLSVGANPSLRSENGHTPLKMAAQDGDMRAVRLLLRSHEKGECSCRSHSSSLGYALAYGHYDIAKVLLEDSVVSPTLKRVSARIWGHDGSCWDALAAAVYYGACGADDREMRELDEKDNASRVLMMGCAWGKPSAVEAALRSWGRLLLNKRDVMERQPLHLACLFGHMDIVQRLARYKELRVNDVEDEANTRRTALMIAAAEGHVDIVAFLIEHTRADTSLKDKMGWTALDHARECGHQDVVEYLTRPVRSSEPAIKRGSKASHAKGHKQAAAQRRSGASNKDQLAASEASERAQMMMTQLLEEEEGQQVGGPLNNGQRKAETSAKKRKHSKKKRAKPAQDPVEAAEHVRGDASAPCETLEAMVKADDSQKQDDAAQVAEARKEDETGLVASKIHASADHLSCPISMTLLTDPVAAADNNTYQREYIEDWFRNCDTAGRQVTSPLTGLPLPSRELKPNNLVKSLVLEHIRAIQQAEGQGGMEGI